MAVQSTVKPQEQETCSKFQFTPRRGVVAGDFERVSDPLTSVG